MRAPHRGRLALGTPVLSPGSSKSRHELLGEDMAPATDGWRRGAPPEPLGYKGRMERATLGKAGSRHMHGAVSS